MGVCNAAESLLVHKNVAEKYLPRIAEQLKSHGVEIVGDNETCKLLPGIGRATEKDFAMEFLGPKLSVAVVRSIDEAIDHINLFGSRHTDAIVTSDDAMAERFAARVDTAVVLINASTRFNDGGELGIGVEIGISTGQASRPWTLWSKRVDYIQICCDRKRSDQRVTSDFIGGI